MLVKLVELIDVGFNEYVLRDLYINSEQIIYMSEDLVTKSKLMEGKINLDINKHASFTKIKLNCMEYMKNVVVVGAPSYIENKIFSRKTRTLLQEKK